MRSVRSRLVVAVQVALVVSILGAPGGAIAAQPDDPGSQGGVTVPAPSAEPVVPPPDTEPAPATDPGAAPPEATPDPVPPIEQATPTPAPTETPAVDPAPAEPPAEPVAPVAPDAAPDAVTTPTVTTLVADPSVLVPGEPVALTATVAPAPGCGSVTFTYGSTTSDPVLLDGSGQATFNTTGQLGVLEASAVFGACDVYDGSTGTAQVDARYLSAVSLDADRYTAVQYEQPVTFYAYVGTSVAPTGSVEFRVAGDPGTLLGTVVVSGGSAELMVVNLPVGVDEVFARYLGDAATAPADSDPLTITVTADTSVKTSSVTVQYTRFYPRDDDYKDTDRISGRTLEPATVSVRIYNRAGTRVKSWSLGTKNGSYGVTWTGRKSDGALLAEGTYTVKQIFKDGRGNAKTVTSSVYLSHKRLYWYVKTQTRYADTGVFGYNGSAGAYKSTKFYRGVVLDGGYYEGELAVGRYQFSLPDATIYKSVRVSAYGKSYSPYGKGFLTVHNWDTGDLDGYGTVGYGTGWYSSASVSGSAHVNSNGTVRVYVAAVGDNLGIVDYQKVKLTYKYAVLKY